MIDKRNITLNCAILNSKLIRDPAYFLLDSRSIWTETYKSDFRFNLISALFWNIE